MRDCYVAVDFGGGSGRVLIGYNDGNSLTLKEIHRFRNRQVCLGGFVHWDFLSLYADMVEGLKRVVTEGYRIKSIGIDTWGVDFGLIDRNGNLLGNPIAYRDSHTDGLPTELFGDDAKAAKHYSTAGIQIMSINTLFQLYAMAKRGDVKLEQADKLLFTPDLFSYFLTGTANNEYSIASTSELLDAKRRDWNWELIDELKLPRRIFGEIVMPGTVRGKLTDDVKAELGIDYDVNVIAVGSHDTASAVHAIPSTDSRKAFLSSGTWSLLGVVLDEPILTENAYKGGFSNEGTIDGKITFLQNITGLWILQRLIAQWKELGLETDYDVIISAAEKSDISSIIDVDCDDFQNPRDMQKAIQDYCKRTSQQVPENVGEYVKCVLLSLAARYKKGIEHLNKLLPQPIEQLQIIGGGSRNRLLNRLTEEATGVKVIAGPVEATAIGNILVQAKAINNVCKENVTINFV